MHKKIFCLLFFLVILNAFADEALNINSLERQLKYCQSLTITRDNITAGFKCDRDAWINFGSNSNYNAIKSGSSNLAFVILQLINLFEDADRNPNYSKSDFNEKSKLLVSLYGSEQSSMMLNLQREIKEISVQEANSRSSNFINNLALMLSGVKMKSDAYTSTYIINGRTIICRVSGSFTNCF